MFPGPDPLRQLKLLTLAGKQPKGHNQEYLNFLIRKPRNKLTGFGNKKARRINAHRALYKANF